MHNMDNIKNNSSKHKKGIWNLKRFTLPFFFTFLIIFLLPSIYLNELNQSN